ncbi:hypothetical protein EI200_22470 [Peribacillus simplex]|uniref:hypothetical protein n=1 Tax=Peribacillus simplex TaxID=1478 RepID=UPI000F62D7DE|nr:hypothetical protein [Peribacillus simplex]RRN67550.1 hypothetical protein EI200_22470 [Peribacillus simplex]
MKRKYMSEFGLHTFSSFVSLCYPNDLQTVSKEPRYHIYMINKIPKLTFIKGSLVIKEDSISVGINIKTETDNKSKTIDFSFHPLFNHNLFKYIIDKPSKSLTIQGENGGGAICRVLPFYLENGGYLDCEIVYIGQSYGKKGERDAFTRLKSHSTLQKIQSDHLFESPESDIAITLWEFTPRLLTSFDGIRKEFEKSSQEDIDHMQKVLENPPLKIDKQLINITEAALINYFKPEYNQHFKNNFPDVGHDYKYYYDLDFNSILVELDPSAINAGVYSKEKKYKVFNPIEYTLHPEMMRKSMFDIFGE